MAAGISAVNVYTVTFDSVALGDIVALLQVLLQEVGLDPSTLIVNMPTSLTLNVAEVLPAIGVAAVSSLQPAQSAQQAQPA